MSAISVVWSTGGNTIAAGFAAAVHRKLESYGPDGGAVWADGDIALGVNFFRTLPEDRFDSQPMWTFDGSACLIADLRLDNRADLSRELGIVHPEESPDSAILLAAWQRWGTSCLDRILGGFAFAVWTPGRQELFAARDHSGERPLFYHRSQGLFALASMPAGLLVLPAVSRDINESHAATWLAGLRQDRATTFFQGIEAVAPGHFLRITPEKFESRCYWHPSKARAVRYRRDEEYAEALVEILDRATEARLRSPHPMGSLLSAGLDSSSVTVSAARLLARHGSRLTAFTAVPRPEYDAPTEPGCLTNEGAGAAEIAGLYPNIDHFLVDSRGHDLVNTMQRWSQAMGEPANNVVNLLWYDAILDRAKQRGIGLLLEGAEGNATLSWYTWSILGQFFQRGRWSTLLRTARALHARGALSYRTAARYATRGLIPPRLTPLLIADSKQDGLYERLVSPGWMRRYGLRRRIFDSVYCRPLRPTDEQARLYRMTDDGPLRAATQALTGVEVRDPTADKRLYEFCFSIPQEQYIVDGHSRSLARRSMKGRLPDSVRLRYTRGLQGADWYLPLADALPRLQADLALFERSHAVREAVDLPAMRRLVEHWPHDGFHTAAVYRRWHHALVPAISFAYFVSDQESSAQSSMLKAEQAKAAPCATSSNSIE